MSAENQNQEAAIDPQVEAPGEEPVNGDLMGRLLHQELHDGEVFNENYQIMLYRLMSAMSAASTKTVVESLDTRRANKVKELVNIFNVLYTAISTDNLMITETETQRVHCQMADNLVRIAQKLVRVTTRRVVNNGGRVDVREEVYSNLIADAQLLRNNVYAGQEE